MSVRPAARGIKNYIRQVPVELLGQFITERFLSFDPVRFLERGKIEPAFLLLPSGNFGATFGD